MDCTCTAQYSCKRESQRVNSSDVDKASDVLYIQIKTSICRSVRRVVDKFWPGGIGDAVAELLWLQPFRLARWPNMWLSSSWREPFLL